MTVFSPFTAVPVTSSLIPTHRVLVGFANLSLIFFLLLPCRSRAAENSAALSEALKGDYTLTKPSRTVLGIDYNRLIQSGSVLVVRIPGIYADAANTRQTVVRTKIEDGQAFPQEGFLASFIRTSRQLKPGEAVYVTRIAVKPQEPVSCLERRDAIHFELVTENATAVTVRGETRQTRYRAELVFLFPAGTLEKINVDDVKKTIDAVMADKSHI